MTTHVTVALNNVTLRGDDVDPSVLLVVGEIQNDFLECNRQVLAEHLMRIILFGNSTYTVNYETGVMELVDL